MPKLKEILFGTKDKVKKVPTLTPQQERLMQLLTEGITKGEGPLSDLFGSFDEKSFEESIAEPALKSFQNKILPMLQEKFISSGQVGGSGMRNAQLSAATDLQDRLAQLMYQARQQHQQQRLSGISQALGTRGFENLYKQGSPGAAQSLTSGLSSSLGNLIGSAVAG